jgi:hypothetical protein
MKALRIVQNSFVQNQPISNSTEGEKNMLGRVFHSFLDDLIRSNAKYKHGAYELFACDLPYEDKKIFLSWICSAEDYEDYISNPTRERVAIAEYEDFMQRLIDENIDDVWHEDMQEMGRTLCHCKQTGEPYYR